MSFDPDHYRMGWNYPAPILTGPGRIRELPGLCRELGMSAPLLIIDTAQAGSIGHMAVAAPFSGPPSITFNDHQYRDIFMAAVGGRV